jgi:spermidine synthase
MFLNNKKTLKFTLPLFTLGFTTSIVQVILIREIVNTFYSNELIIGVVLAFWMLLTGIGALISIKRTTLSDTSLFTRFAFLSILPVILVISISLFRHFFFLPGELVNIWKLLPFISALLLPYCVLSGNIFSLISNLYKSEGQLQAALSKANSGRLYSFESLGSILGGLVAGLIMVLWLNTLQSLAINCFLVLLMAVICYLQVNLVIKTITVILLLVVPFLTFFKSFDKDLKHLLFNNQNILKTKETPYGNLTFTFSSGQINVFENQELMFFSENITSTEEAAHFAMLQRKEQSKVLLIGGGISGIANQILKYPSVKSLVYVESNPWLLKYSAEYFSLPNDRRLQTVRKDGRIYLEHDSSRYNIIIVSIAPPSSLQLNRYYTAEFFKKVKEHCSSGAVFSISASSSENYMNAENRMLHSVLYKTLQTEFKNPIVIPGEKDYFLASDDSLSTKISWLYDQNSIKNEYVNSGFIDDRSLAERSNSIRKTLQSNVPVNKDYEPVASNISISLFFSRFKVNSAFFIFVIVIVLLIPVFWLKRNSMGMYLTGFTSSSLEIIILMLFQIMFGFLYAAVGVLFAIFMAGLAAGSWKGLSMKNAFLVMQAVLTLLVIIVPILLITVNNINIDAITYSLFFVCTFVVAMITGMQYANQLKLVETSNAGYIYGLDLAGSALGVMLVSAVFLPAFGLALSVTIIFIINVIAIAFLVFSVNRNVFRNG